jgi:hypothetical protein
MSLGGDSRHSLAPARPKCNSILHLFGEWLFEAAYIGFEAAYHGKGLTQSKFMFMHLWLSTPAKVSYLVVSGLHISWVIGFHFFMFYGFS